MTSVLRLALLIRRAPRQPRDEWQHTRRAVLARDGERCQLRRLAGWGPTCGRPAEHVDHLMPVSWGGSSDASNLRAACARCNLRKGARPPAGWLALRVVRAAAVYGAIAWAAMSWPRSDTSAGTWAVMAPGGRLVRSFDTREDAERARATWDGGRSQLVVERSAAP